MIAQDKAQTTQLKFRGIQYKSKIIKIVAKSIHLFYQLVQYIGLYLFINQTMVKLSSYSNGYEDGKYELMPWEFWTEQEKSFVLWKAYDKHYLSSPQVKKYLQISRTHMWTQFLIPALTAGAYFGFLRNSVFQKLYRTSPYRGNSFGIALVGITSALWFNLSPFYQRKEAAQEQLLDVLYHKIGISMKSLNDALPRSRTSGEMDRYSMFTYFKRNYVNPEDGDDFNPPLLKKNKTYNYANKKIYL